MIKDGAIVYKGEHIINLDEIKIVGKHNIANMMIAICSAMLSNVDKEIIYKTLSSFMGVEHRIEYVRELNGVKYYNTKNSWGHEYTKTGHHMMSENYVKGKTMCILVHKNSIPKEIRKKLGL